MDFPDSPVKPTIHLFFNSGELFSLALSKDLHTQWCTSGEYFIGWKIYSHLNALTMNSFSIPFEDSINAQALEHEKMYTPKLEWSLTTSSRSYKSSWQPISRTSRGVRTTAVATRPGSSNADLRTKRTTPATRARTQRTPAQAPARWMPVPAWRTPAPSWVQALRAPAAAGGACSSCTGPKPCREGGGTGC